MSERSKNMILTGASRGIGHATVKRFSAENWRIITCSRDDVPEACKRDPNWSHHIPTDRADTGSVEAFVEQALEALADEPLHALVNNAAVSPKTSFKERLGCLNGGLDGWREVFELNFFTPLSLSRGFAAALSRGAAARTEHRCRHHRAAPSFSRSRRLRSQAVCKSSIE